MEPEMELEELLIQLQTNQSQRVYGKYAGTVVDNVDQQSMGRLKVKVPAVLKGESVWAMPCVPYAGDGVGFYFIPPNDAGVWVEFEGGDTSRAIWTGCYWSQGQLPIDATSPDIKVLASDKATLKIDDTSGDVVLTNTNNATTTWSSDVKTEAGSATQTVGAAGVVSESSPGKVEVGAAGVTINNGAFKVT
jgi:uncharacterized protein involved in type VI secretion and phage assembly